MRIKYLSRVLAVALVLAMCAVAASAQVVQVSGTVKLRQTDGTEVPVKDAVVDIYRTDITGKFETKTDKNGRYIHAGIPFSGTYTLAVSAPGARPTYVNGIRLSQKPVNDVTLEPGDGSRLTLDQIRKAGSGGGGGGSSPSASAESKEDKARREEREREIARINESNKKIEEGNVVVSRTFKAGNEALNANRYDEAIALYNEGLAAREETALYTNKSEALRRRGVERYNAAIRNADATAKAAGLESAFKDWREAAESASKAVEMIKTQQAGMDPTAPTNLTANKLAALQVRAAAMGFVAKLVDKPQAEAAFTAYQEYIAAEPDPTKKAKAQMDAAQMLFDANAYEHAAAEFQKILAADPDNATANLKLGFALFNMGDKAKFQEAANYIQRFVEKAPDTDPLKADAKSILDFLKTQENIKPEKVQTSRPGRRRG